MASSRNLLSSSDPNSYGGDDAFDTYIDMDFLRNDNMEEDIDIGNMSTSDLFRYYLEGELAKDATNLDSETYTTSMQNVEDFSLVTSPASVSEEPKPNNIDVVEETNVLSQSTNVSTAVGPSLAMLNAQLAELLAKLPIIKRETIADNKVTMLSGSSTPENSTFPTLNTASKPSTAPNNSTEGDQKHIDDNSQIDLKKLSSKERRQLRNKISARNFRVRRKEYIQSLESTKEQQQEEINLLRQALLHLQEENNKLQQEVEELRKLKQQNSKAFVNPPPSPPHNSSLTTKDINGHAFSKNGNAQRSNSVKAPQNHQPSSPDSRYLIPNLNKDTSPSSSSAGKKAWQDSRVRVQTTFIPEFNLDKHLFEGKSDLPYYSLWNNITNEQPVRWDLFDIGSNKTSQKALFACMLLSTIMQRITALFIEAVCATPHHLMIPALFPKAVSTPQISIESFQSQEIAEKKESESDEIHNRSPDSLSASNKDYSPRTVDVEEPLLDNTSMVESIKDASVLDWLYDSMVKHVVEQSQMEARMMELSDWVGEELDDNVLPYLF
ncbi:3932_t:CDS:2 [Acaulospora morrowiae]|uniref:3932_t:CDS:1 n=1 Tax=Acaulospora morrowiae TaxID=94023 RepID=A0A9N9G2B3_9GLOM|nr:3932_t:CDS:2 [Acaulospora morrowiae]